MKQKIIPHIWFNNRAIEAVSFYVDTIPNSKLESILILSNTPSGETDVLEF